MKSTEELKALLQQGIDYRKTVAVKIFFGETKETVRIDDEGKEIKETEPIFVEYGVEIQPVDDNVMRKLIADTDSDSMIGKMLKDKLEHAEESDIELAKRITNPVMMIARNTAINIELCKIGIVDKQFAKMVTEHPKWNIVDQLGMEIRKISAIPPEELKSFL